MEWEGVTKGKENWEERSRGVRGKGKAQLGERQKLNPEKLN